MSNVTPSSSENGMANYYQKALQNLENELQSETKRHRQAREEELERSNQNHEASLKKKDQEMSQAVQEIRARSNEAIVRDQENYQQELEQLKGQLYNTRGQLSDLIPYSLHKKQIEDLNEYSQKRHEQDSKIQGEQQEEMQSRMDELTKHQNKNVRDLENQYARENARLASEMKEAHRQDQELANEQQKYLLNEMQTQENNQHSELKRAQNAYETQIDQLRDETRTREAKNQKQSDALREKDAYLSETIARLNDQHHSSVHTLEQAYQNQFRQLENQQKKQELAHSHEMGISSNEANQQQKLALENQANAYQTTLTQLNQNKDNQIQQLQKELYQQGSTPDVGSVSPALEDKIRQSFLKEYRKTFRAEAERNRINEDRIQKKYEEPYKRAVDSLETREREIYQKHATERNEERMQYFDSIQNTEFRANDRLKEQEYLHERERDTMARQFGSMFERQSKEYEQVVDTIRNDAKEKIFQAQKENDENIKLAQRTLSAKQNELIREYEKKLADQKKDYELTLEDVKIQTQSELRKTDSRSKQELENQAKGYEQKLSQIDAQYKERERNLSQIHQEELDRIRRSYELASQKKS